jgi:hypothetical protein
MIPAPDGTLKGKLEYRAFIQRSRADGFVRLRFAEWGGAGRHATGCVPARLFSSDQFPRDMTFAAGHPPAPSLRVRKLLTISLVGRVGSCC